MELVRARSVRSTSSVILWVAVLLLAATSCGAGQDKENDAGLQVDQVTTLAAIFLGALVLLVMIPGALALLVAWRFFESRHSPPRNIFCIWGPIDALLVILLFFFLPGALASILPKPFWFVGAILPCVLGLVHLNRTYGISPADFGLRFPGRLRHLLLVAGALLLMLSASLVLGASFKFISVETGEELEEQPAVKTLRNEQSVPRLAVLVFVVVAVAPVCEEIVFRGFLQPVLRKHYGNVSSIVVTAVFFAGIHTPFLRLRDESASVLSILRSPVMVMPLALTLGYCYHKTQRLLPGIMLHCLFNSATVIVVFLARMS